VVWNGRTKATRPKSSISSMRHSNAVLADPRLQARFADLGGAPMPMTPASLASSSSDDTEKWAKVVRFSGARAE